MYFSYIKVNENFSSIWLQGTEGRLLIVKLVLSLDLSILVTVIGFDSENANTDIPIVIV